MDLFSSDRERQLWLWASAVAVAIFATLGLARTLSDELRNRELIDSAFVLGLLLIGAAVVALALTTRPGRVEIGVWLGIAAVYLLLFLRMAIPEERTHLIEYSVLAIFIHQALMERNRNGRRVTAPAVTAMVAASAIGVLDEGVQLLLPFRVFDPIDIAFNTLAAVVAVAAGVTLMRLRDRRSTPDR